MLRNWINRLGVIVKPWVKIIWSFVSPCLYIFDVGTDSYAGHRHFENGDTIWGILAYIFISLPIIITCIINIHKIVQDDSMPHKIMCVAKAIIFAPFRPFYLIVVNFIANLRGHVDDEGARNVGFLRLLEAMLETLPQGTMQLFIIFSILVKTRYAATEAEPWQLNTVTTSIISLAFTVSTSNFLFPKAAGSSKAAFFFLGIIALFSRLWVFSLYISFGLSHKLNTLCLLYLGTMLLASITVWFVKQYFPRRDYMLPLYPGVHCSRDMWGVVIVSWVLTSAYNCFTLSGLLLSTINLAFVSVLCTTMVVTTEGETPAGHIISITPALVSFTINVILVAVPRCRRIGYDWLSINQNGTTNLY
ncbi:unnamed protein product [Meganyctiphanes norvegica]|uniref:XK-related protein n=1 Tax=Meganyctiphanes norvegica TaxID=48144 RepID=A0AAV2RXR4_MEGNR